SGSPATTCGVSSCRLSRLRSSRRRQRGRCTWTRARRPLRARRRGPFSASGAPADPRKRNGARSKSGGGDCQVATNGRILLAMKRATAAVLLCVAVSSPALAQRTRAAAPGGPPPSIGESFAGLSPDQRALFAAGKHEFNFLFEVQDGLGPMFNQRACTICHLDPTDGGGSFRTVTRVGKIIDGQFDPLTQIGGAVREEGKGATDGHLCALSTLAA